MKKYIYTFCLTALAIFSTGTIAHAAIGLQYATTNNLLATSTIIQGNNNFATTSPSYMTAGNGTTTLTMYTANVDEIGLNLMLISSTTPPTLNWRYEFSSNALDWYTDDFPIDISATSSIANPTFQNYSWVFASSTGGTSNPQRNLKHINMNAGGSILASPYTRVLFYLPIGSPAAALNVQAVLKTNNTI